MSPVGHTLTGIAIGVLTLPTGASVRSRLVWLAATAGFANAPDLPLPCWGHDRYDISHSVFITTLGVFVWVLIALSLRTTAWRVPLRLGVACALAWFSHLLLDTFYNHGKGLAIFWPLNEGRVALPVPYFSTLRLDTLFCHHNLEVAAIEGAAFGLLLAVSVGAKALMLQPVTPNDR